MTCDTAPPDASGMWTLWWRHRICPSAWYFWLARPESRECDTIMNSVTPQGRTRIECVKMPPGECPMMDKAKCHRGKG